MKTRNGLAKMGDCLVKTRNGSRKREMDYENEKWLGANEK